MNWSQIQLAERGLEATACLVTKPRRSSSSEEAEPRTKRRPKIGRQTKSPGDIFGTEKVSLCSGSVITGGLEVEVDAIDQEVILRHATKGAGSW